MPANGNLQNVLTRLKLRRLAGPRAFELGAEYFAADRVLNLSELAGKLIGVVRGTTEYDVTLSAEGDALAFDCTCPMGAEGGFCKHCVALGLAWLSGDGDRTRANRNAAPAAAALTPAEVRSWLAKKEKGALVEIILARAAEDARFRNQLLLHIASEEKSSE